MARHGKRYQNAKDQIEEDKTYGPRQALELLKGMAANFDQTVEVAIRLGVDAKQGNQMVRGTVSLPHGSGRSLRIAAFAKGEKAAEAEQAGADLVGAEDLVKKIQEGWKDFDVLVATRDMMKVVGPLGKKLGPKMPNPKAGTLSEEIGKTIQDLKSGKVEFRMDKGGIIHLPIGKVSYSVDQLLENLSTLISALLKARPAGAKGQFLQKISLSSTMSPGITLDLAEAQQVATEA